MPTFRGPFYLQTEANTTDKTTVHHEFLNARKLC